ncbi:MAG TPA: YkvS family protein [Bacillales bacterium]|nr:YkvS family protein [Bacillales bacterium]
MSRAINIPKNRSKNLPFSEKAKVGDIVEFFDRKQDTLLLHGSVILVLDNSIIVDLTIMKRFNSLNLEYEKTVVSHRRYKVLKAPVA